MNPTYSKAFDAFRAVFEAHIGTKTTDPVFHDLTTSAYESLFELAHQIGEKGEDTNSPLGNETPMDLHKKAYDAVEELKDALETAVKGTKLTVGADNLYRGGVDKLEFICGNLAGFIKRDAIEKKEEPKEEEAKRGDADMDSDAE